MTTEQRIEAEFNEKFTSLYSIDNTDGPLVMFSSTDGSANYLIPEKDEVWQWIKQKIDEVRQEERKAIVLNCEHEWMDIPDDHTFPFPFSWSAKSCKKCRCTEINQ